MEYGTKHVEWNECKEMMDDVAGRMCGDDIGRFCAECDAACCRSDLIILHPEQGDDAGAYDTVDVTNPLTGEKVQALRRKPDGSCIYLSDGRCSIHGRHPVICRAFDCGRMFDAWDAKKRMKFVRAGWLTRRIIRQGRKVSNARKVIRNTVHQSF